MYDLKYIFISVLTMLLSKFSGVKSYPNEWNLTQNEWKYCHSISRVAVFSLIGV